MRADSDSLRRVVGRTAEYGVQPDPPRGIKFSLGKLSWEKPRNTKGLTHFNIYANTEGNLVRRVPAGQLELQDNLTADRVFVASFNAASNIQSSPVVLQQAVAPVASGGGGFAYRGGWHLVPIVSGHAVPNPIAAYTNVVVVVAALTIDAPTVTSLAGDFMDLRIEQDATTGGFNPTFGTIYHISPYDVVGLLKGTYTNLPLVYDGTFWCIRAIPVANISL